LTDTLAAAATHLREELVETRRDLHRNPELSFEERRTAALCAERLEDLGFSVSTGVGPATGVIGDIDGAAPGPTLMVRADTDALPIVERGGDGRPAVSGVVGAMHACGHDGHVSIALGVASVLAGMRDTWSGRLRMCFQPAEEVAGGAEPMIAAGAAKGVDAVLGIHLWAPLEAGKVAVTAGPLFGSADEFKLTVRGRGGHGGLPHTSIDPIVAAAAIVSALQTIASRETSPFAPVVVTVGKIEGGSAFNVIAEEVRLLGTVRALDQDIRERTLERIAEIGQGVASGYRCSAVFERLAGCPPVVSDADMADLVRRAAVEALGEERVDHASPITVGDDVALFLDAAPGCYFLVGAGRPGRDNAPHHHPEFDIDEACLPVGVEVLTRAALDVLKPAVAST
jgi:amidohydrolase